MPPPPLYVVKNKGGAPRYVRALLGGVTLDPTTIGNSYSETEDTPNDLNITQSNLVVEFKGDVYMWHYNQVRRLNQSTSNWDSVHTLSNNPGNEMYSGLHVVDVNGVSYLCGIYSYNNSGMQWRGLRTTDGTTWAESALTSDSNGPSHSGKSVVFGNRLFWFAGASFDSTPLLIAMDPSDWSNETWTGTDLQSADIDTLPGADLLVHQDNLFITPSDAQEQSILRLDGSSWTRIFVNAEDNVDDGGSLLISDGDDLILISSGLSASSWKVYRVENVLFGESPTVTDISGTVVPSGLGTGDYRFWKFRDNTTPGSQVWYFWSVLDHDAGTYDCYQWNGIASAITNVGFGIAASDYTIMDVGNGGRDRIPAAPEARPALETVGAQVIGGRRRFFKVYGTGSDVNLRQYHDANQEAPGTLSTLIAASVEISDAIDTTGLVGNLGELALEGLSPSSGDAYVVSATDGDSTLNPGSLAIAVGDIVEYDGANWVQSVANSGGFPPFGTHATLNSTTALIAPYTDGADDGLNVSFGGASLDGTVLTVPTNTTSQINGVTPDEGATSWQYTHDVDADGLLSGDIHTVMLDTV